VVQTLQALDDAPSDFPPRAFIVMTHRERGFFETPPSLRPRVFIHRLKKGAGEMPDSTLETLRLLRHLHQHTPYHTLFLCSKHIVITARHVLPRLLALCQPDDTLTAFSYGSQGIDTHPLILHGKTRDNPPSIGFLPARGAKGTPFADRRILFDPDAVNDQPLKTQLQMDFVRSYPDLIRRPFIDWTKVYDTNGQLLLLFADHNSTWLAYGIAQADYGILTMLYRQQASSVAPIVMWLRKIQQRYLYNYLIFREKCKKYTSARYYAQRWTRLCNSLRKRLPL
ncbi:MAG: hypothetical protein GDA50_07590, partial [Alphaproteobacteria bacterium GM202ARS2]|nr:hypothetical protein [Alphaproteobacteria bacterium GM202ARS2]